MPKRSFWSGIAVVPLLLLGGAAPAVHYPERTVLLLVASWCAPCRVELAHIDEIARAAAPYDVRVLLVDDSKAGRRMVAALSPARRWLPDPAVAAPARAALLSRTPGLPYSVAIGPKGAICADRRGGLDPARTRALVARCRAP